MNDFQAIGAVVSDTRLINHDLSPSSYGVPKGSDDTVYPPHWQRMRALDAAADFVASHHDLLDCDSTGQPLPQFLTALQQHKVLSDGLPVTQQALDHYSNARTNLLTGDYTEAVFDEFNNLLLKISQYHLRKSHATTSV